MQGLDAGSLLRSEQEFRSLAGLNHVNLVTLYELNGDGPHWFFTMELIEGVSFLHYISEALLEVQQLQSSVDVFPQESSKRGRQSPLNGEEEKRLRAGDGPISGRAVLPARVGRTPPRH